VSTAKKEVVEILKEALEEINRGASIDELRKKYGEVLSRISPVEVVLAEQSLLESGTPLSEILRFCDFHVELVKDYLSGVRVEDLPEGHPLKLLVRENEEILKLAEATLALALNASREQGQGRRESMLSQLAATLGRLRRALRQHYRKNQMLLFPYLERAGIEAPPRVLWSREDNVIRKLWMLEDELRSKGLEVLASLSEELKGITREVSELIIRENKILYPTMKAILGEGEWSAVHREAERIGYIVEPVVKWTPQAPPVYPYEWVAKLTKESIEELPPEIRGFAEAATPDNYTVYREGDIVTDTGFLTCEELEGIFRGLPLEVTFADANDRVRFFSESSISGGFPRTKTILSRKLLFCHPPRLEKYVQLNVELLKKNKERYREFWTRLGDRILRVLVVGVRDKDGNYLGTLEVVEDFTDILRNAQEIVERKVVVL